MSTEHLNEERPLSLCEVSHDDFLVALSRVVLQRRYLVGQIGDNRSIVDPIAPSLNITVVSSNHLFSQFNNYYLLFLKHKNSLPLSINIHFLVSTF